EQDTLTSTVDLFRKRAKRLRRNAALTITMIISVLVIGILIFIFAGALANREANQALVNEKLSRLKYIQSVLKESEDEYEHTQAKMADIQIKLEGEVGGTGGTRVAGQGP